MKAFKSQVRTKGSRKKPKFILSPSMFSHLPPTDESEALKICLPEADEEIAWAFKDKNEMEMKAVEDLCALSDESQIIDIDLQQAWLKTIILPKREASTASKETHSLSLRISKREGMRLGLKSPKKTDRETARIVPKLKLDDEKPSKNFIKENTLLRNRMSKQQETIIRGQIQKLLNNHQTEICSSLTASKDEITERNNTNEARENDEEPKAKNQKSIFASTYHSREPSWQERLLQGISHRNSTRQDDENYEHDKEKGRKFMNQSIDLKAISTPKDFRPRSTGRPFENFRAPPTKISNQEAFELIERYEQINGVKTRNVRPQSESQSRRIRPKLFKGSAAPYPPLELKIDGINNRNRSPDQEKPTAPKGKVIKITDRIAKRSSTLNIETAQIESIIPQSTKKEKEEAKEDPIEKVQTIRKTKLGSKQAQNLKGLDFHFLITKDASLAPNSFIEIQEDVYPAHRRLKSHIVEVASPSLRTLEERERIKTTEMSILKTQECVQPLSSARSHTGLNEAKKGVKAEKGLYELYKKVEKEAFRAVDHLDKIDTYWKAPENFQVHSTHSTSRNKNRPLKTVDHKNTDSNRPVAPPLIVNYRTLTISEQQKSPRTVILKASRGKVK